ncbi:TonB-dependent receptor [Kordiimonas lacus]|uniref:Iron complex outermembrane recepter protein n=1 Tax=Kordiimonas lacus TaxID=637679 RepID=A0A1G6ZIS5_9PROT|nr:TonB-dependent receptor [Kordiimonas lacus]SDE02343.1 iron complex outermembrane recepter protein [Kordiimonas lacus]
MSFTKRTLYRSVSAIALASVAMAAQAQESQDSGMEEFEEITITGIRGALRQSLETKRASYAIVDAISAEDIGKFPDKNVAESLQRISGVTIQRQFGEGQGVAIRGASQNMTLTTLNGQNVASTGWFVFEPARRSFNYSLLPSELVGNIEVYKSSQADLNEGGVGGTVVINTRKPLEMDDLSIYASAEGAHTNDSGEIDPQLSGLVSWKNERGNFGVLMSAVYQRRQMQRQGNEAFWEWGAGPVAFEQDRKRRAFNTTVQFEPTDALTLTANWVDMQMKADNTNYALWLTQGNTSWSGVDVPENCLQNATPVCGPLGVAYYQARPREATMKSRVYDFDAEYRGDGYQVDFQIGKTTSSGGTDFEMVLEDGTGGTAIPGGTYDFTGGNQTWDTASFDITSYDPGSLVMGTGSAFNKTPKTDEEFYAQADVEYDVDLGLIKSIKTGLRYADHNTTSRQYIFNQEAGFDPRISTSGLNAGLIDVGAGDYQILRIDADAVKDWAKASITGEATEILGAYSEIDEKNTAAYVMATFEGDGFRGNAGVRYVHTSATSTYYLNNQLTSTNAKYSQFLPSFNVAMDLKEDLVLRASAARVMTRPQYVDMYVNPNVVGANDDLPDNQFWIVGNVGLKPFISDQFDVSLEYYFAEGSILSAGFFLKDVKNFVSNTEYSATTAEIGFPGTMRDTEVPFGWTVQEKINGKSANIKGFELQYQQEFANGFGTVLNYTYTDSAADDADTFTDGQEVLSDASKHSFNATGYYENEDFRARLSYNYRSKYMLRETGAYGNRLHKAYGSLDFSASYYVTSQISVNVDVINILEKSAKQFGNNATPTANSGFTGGFPLYEYEMPRRILVGVSFKY